MSLGDDARTNGLSVELPSRTRSTGLATRLQRALLSGLRWPWMLVELVLVFGLYTLGAFLAVSGLSDPARLQAWPGALYALTFCSIALGLGSYDRDRRFRLQGVVRICFTAAFLATAANVLLHVLGVDATDGRFTLVPGAAVSLAGTLAVRGALIWVVNRQPYRFTVLGRSTAVQEVLDEWSTNVQGTAHELVPWELIFPADARVTGDALVRAGIAEIVVAPDTVSDEEAINVALVAFQANIPVIHDRAFHGRVLERMSLDSVTKRWILEQGIARPQAVVLVLKRMGDLVMSAVGLALLSPFFLIIAAAIKATSPGPVFFVQTRQGRYLRPFRMLKFRTMRNDADVLADSGFARVGDSRVTAIGRILRRAHFDELPQLINILRGEMSVVGPRPEAVEFARRMDAAIPLYELRYLVRPGLTGHAQLKQGYAADTVIDTQAKLSYDLYYLCNYSLRLDIRLMLRTVFFLIRGSR